MTQYSITRSLWQRDSSVSGIDGKVLGLHLFFFFFFLVLSHNDIFVEILFSKQKKTEERLQKKKSTIRFF